jgi:hypothetical protein
MTNKETGSIRIRKYLANICRMIQNNDQPMLKVGEAKKAIEVDVN